MSLIEQLKQTPKWIEFEKWWCDNYFLKVLVYNHINISFECFCSFPFEFQEGVFKEYLKSNKHIITNHIEEDEELFDIYSLKYGDSLTYDLFNTFEELILWYFNK